MMWYAIISEDNENSLPLRATARDAHLARLRSLAAEGRLLVAGPHPAVDAEDAGEAGFTGSLVVAEFASLEDATQWADADPYVAGAAVTAERVKSIEECLEAGFSPSHLQVKDQSHLHAGHAGARDGMGHFEVTIVAQAFEGKSRIQRHRLIYAALGTLMETDIHALKINAYTPAER